MEYVNPYAGTAEDESAPKLRANFHLHAGGSGYGIDVLDAVLRYKEAGYDVWGIANHNGGEVELLDPDDLARYQSESGVTILNGYEYGWNGRHIVCANVTSVFDDLEDYQGGIDCCNREGGFAIMAHFNLGDREWRRFKLEELLSLTGYLGIEILNTGKLHDPGVPGMLATNAWDYVLGHGRLVWAFAGDDFHRWYHLGQAWNTVFAESADRDSVLAAVRAGRHYCSTGLELERFAFDGAKILVEAESKDWAGSPNRYVFTGEGGAVLSTVEGKSAEYAMRGDEPYVRVRAHSEAGHSLWTQPVYNPEFFTEGGGVDHG